MADRSRRVRRQISDVTEESSDGSQSESGEDWAQRTSGPGRNSGRFDSSASATPSNTRPKRSAASGSNSTSSATIHRSTSGSPDDRRQSIRLTVKMPPSKLREVMRANEVDSLQDVLGGGRVLDGPRSRRAVSGRKIEKPRYAEYGESDIEDEDEEDNDEEEEEEGDEDDEEEDEEEPLNDFDELGGEPEGGTDDEDEEMEDIVPAKQPAAPKPPKITLKAPSNSKAGILSKPKVVVTPAQVGPLKSVEDQEMEDDPGDEEVESSELSEDNEGVEIIEEGEGDEEMEDEEEDAEGEDEDMDDDGEGDSSDETTVSGMATPDLNKMTKRQRGAVGDENLYALDMAPQQRKFFTDQEKAMKKDEHARKRKELTKRKIQEEKAAALNRLLKPQASKGRGGSARIETMAGTATAGSQVDEEEDYFEKANPLYTRWISNKDGIKLGVPEEWLGKRFGQVFEPQLAPSNRKLVQETE